MSRTSILMLTLVAYTLILIGSAGVALAKVQPVVEGGKTYYVVNAADPAQNSGDKVCALVGKQCVGYTAFTTNVCTNAHPSAAIKSDVNGSKAGFYCDGTPQGGVCATEKNTCHICPTCNINADCTTQIGDLYREMYVECSLTDEGAQAEKLSAEMAKMKSPASSGSVWTIPGRWWSGLRDSVQRSFDYFRQILGRLTMVTVKHVVVQVQGPDGTVSADIPEDSYLCEFYQQNKKLATCSALAAAAHFCVTAMDSRFAKAALCQDDGLIVCTNPCKTNPAQVMPKRCAFDGDRPRGNQAPPLDFCTETVTVDTKTGPTKKAGEVCAHGGEGNTGFCLGQPSDNGIKYF